MLTLAVAWAYVRYGSLPEVRPALAGIQVAVAVIVLRALVDFGRSALTTRWAMLIAVASAIACVAGIHELLILVLAGLIAWIAARAARALLPGIASMPIATITSAMLLLVAAGAFAAWIPARRAASITPLLALRRD